MRKLGKACKAASYLAACLLFAADNVLTVLFCGGIALLFGFAAYVLNRV
jgi:hypothetical protein